MSIINPRGHLHFLPMDITIALYGLGHSLKEVDPCPWYSGHLSLVAHWEILDLCYRHWSGEMVQMSLYL